MAIKRTPDAEDARVLRYAGLLGHRYVVTVDDERGGRRVKVESDDPSLFGPVRGSQPRMFEQIRFRTRPGRKWRRVR